MQGFPGYPGAPGDKGDKGSPGTVGSVGFKGERVMFLKFSTVSQLNFFFLKREMLDNLVKEEKQVLGYAMTINRNKFLTNMPIGFQRFSGKKRW